MGVKAGNHEEPNDQFDVEDVIHSLLLLVVSNFDFEFLYKVASRSWVIKNPPKPIKIVLRFGRLWRSLSGPREESAPASLPTRTRLLAVRSVKSQPH
jgi:hypothetical protein